ncbi:MAG: hypothetical protein C4538_05980 [Nitrospiraceae bacterium]|nr:MAG: hypothetical protein C4538_05980 [Nitrospiraceae bacterium]
MEHPRIEKKIKCAQIAAIVCGVITVAGAIALIVNPQNGISLFNFLALIDGAFIFGMAYGIYKKNRTCAVLMFEYFLFSMILRTSISSRIEPVSFMVGWIFLFFLYQGIKGTYAYHKCRTCEDNSGTVKPPAWLISGSVVMIMYVLVLPGLILRG